MPTSMEGIWPSGALVESHDSRFDREARRRPWLSAWGGHCSERASLEPSDARSLGGPEC